MKTFLKIVGGIFLFIALGVGVFYLSIIRPLVKEMNENKSALAEKANTFIACMCSGTVPSCADPLTSAGFKRAVNSESLGLISKKMRTDLGPFHGSSPVEKSFDIKSNASTNGSNKTIVFRLRTSFEKDDSSAIDFVYIKEGESPYLLQKFHINSDAMLK